jgi:hypothetical protein
VGRESVYGGEWTWVLSGPGLVGGPGQEESVEWRVYLVPGERVSLVDRERGCVYWTGREFVLSGSGERVCLLDRERGGSVC